MRFLASDLLLFSCLAVLITSMVIWLRACSSADCRGSDGGDREHRAPKPATVAPRRGFAVGHSRGYSDVGAIGGLVTLDIPPAGASRRSRPRRRAARAAPPFRVGRAGARSGPTGGAAPASSGRNRVARRSSALKPIAGPCCPRPHQMSPRFRVRRGWSPILSCLGPKRHHALRSQAPSRRSMISWYASSPSHSRSISIN